MAAGKAQVQSRPLLDDSGLRSKNLKVSQEKGLMMHLKTLSHAESEPIAHFAQIKSAS